MDSKPYGASIRMDSGLVSYQVPEDHSDNESDDSDHQRRSNEIREEMEDLMQDIVNGDIDDSSHSTNEADFTTGELTFNREINEKNARQKHCATSTPFASTHRRVEVTSVPKLNMPNSPLTDRRGKGDFRSDFLQSNDKRVLFPSSKLDVVPEAESTEFRPTFSGKENTTYGLKQTQSASLSPTYGRLKDVEKALGQPFSATTARGLSGVRSDEVNFRGPSADNASLLAQDSLNPTPTKTQYNKILDEKDRAIHEKDRAISQLNYEITSRTTALQDEVQSCSKTVQALSQDNQALQIARERDQTEIGSLRDQINQLRNHLKENREDLDAMKEEKQELLRKLYIMEGTSAQMKKSMEEMTSWETVESLKTQNEAMILQMKDVNQAELRKIQESNSKEVRRLEDQLSQAQQNLELVREKCRAAESSKTSIQESLTAVQKELIAKTSLNSDQRQDQKAKELLQLQLKSKSEEVDRLSKRNTDLENRLDSQQTAASAESGRLRDELASAVQANIQQLDEQTKTVQENIRLRDDLKRLGEEHAMLKLDLTKLREENSKLAAADRSKAAEINGLKSDALTMKNKMDELNESLTAAQDNILSLQKEVSVKNSHTSSSTGQKTGDKQTVRKDNDFAEAKKKFREVEDNLHSQLKEAATENQQLRDDKTKLQADIHLMKKVLRKLKKHMTGNPSPSGDSGISTENRNDASQSTSVQQATAVGEEDLADRSYTRELIAMKAEMRLDLERKYQQQLDSDRQKIIGQIDAVYMHKLQQVLAKLMPNPIAGNHSVPLENVFQSRE